MADFDPNAYLAKKAQSGGFDPDAYLAKASGPAVEQETHPDVSWASRAAIKNFGGSDEDAIMYLKENYPGLQVEKINGQIAMKRPEEKAFKVLDPEGFDLADITDIGADVASGVGTSIASAGAGLAAAPSVVGALPAAAAAGAGTAGALETLRQAIGKKIGVRQEYDPTQIAVTSAFGGATPLVFGTGASGAAQASKLLKEGGEDYAKRLLMSYGQRVGKGALSTGQKDLAAQLLATSQRGVSRALPKSMQVFSGVGAETIQNANKVASPELQANLGLAGPPKTMLELADDIQTNGASGLISNLSDDVTSKLYQAKQSLQSDIGTALDQTGSTINLGTYEQPFTEAIAKLEAFPHKSKAIKDQIAALKSAKEDLFYHDVAVPQFDAAGTRVGEKIVKQPIGAVGGQQAMSVKQALKDLTDTFAATEGKSPADKEVMRAAQRAYFTLGEDMNSVIGQAGEKLGTRDLMRKYATHMELERSVLPIFKDPSKTFNTLRTLNGKGKQVLRETLQDLDNNFGTNIGETTDLLDVWSTFGNPSIDAVSSGGSTSTSRTIGAAAAGGAVGSEIGHYFGGTPGRIAGGVTGAFVGSKLGSPAAIKQYLKAARMVKPATDVVRYANESPSVMSQNLLNRVSYKSPNALNVGANSAWQMMNNGGGR